METEQARLNRSARRAALVSIGVLAAALIAIFGALAINPTRACPAVAFVTIVTVTVGDPRITTVVCDAGCMEGFPATRRDDGAWDVRPSPGGTSTLALRGLDTAGTEIARSSVAVTVTTHENIYGCTDRVDVSPRSVTLG